MEGRLLQFPMAAEPLQPFPAYQPEERTGVSVCVLCVKPVEREEYFRNDHAHKSCPMDDEADRVTA